MVQTKEHSNYLVDQTSPFTLRFDLCTFLIKENYENLLIKFTHAHSDLQIILDKRHDPSTKIWIHVKIRKHANPRQFTSILGPQQIFIDHWQNFINPRNPRDPASYSTHITYETINPRTHATHTLLLCREFSHVFIVLHRAHSRLLVSIQRYFRVVINSKGLHCFL